MRPHLIKILRRSLIGVIILVLLAVVFNYGLMWYRRARSVQKAAQILSSEMARSFNRIEYSEYQKGVLRFRITATRLLESRQGKSYLEGIEAYDFNPDGSVHNEIRSQRAEYDRDGKCADFSGDVRLFLGKGIELRTESLQYDLNANIGTTKDRVRFISQAASGSATGIRFDQAQESLNLESEVDLYLAAQRPAANDSAAAEKFHAIADRAYCNERQSQMTFLGNAKIESASQFLSGDSIEATLSPERKQVTSLIASGNATYTSGDSNETQTLRGDRMVFGIGETQTLEKINIMGQASFSSTSPTGEESLQSGEIELVFDSVSGMPAQLQGVNSVLFRRKGDEHQLQISGNRLTAIFTQGTKYLESIHVQKQATMIVEGDRAAMNNELRADEILMSFHQEAERAVFDKLRANGSVRWISKTTQRSAAGRQEPARIIAAALLEMLYSKEGTSFESGNASGGVVISEMSDELEAQSGIRRLLADKVQFSFFQGNNLLRDMDADGHVRLIQEKRTSPGIQSSVDNFTASSEKMKVRFLERNGSSAIESMTQWGNFRYADASMSATAGRCEYDARMGRLVLRDSPRISDEMNSTMGKWMEYQQDPGLLSVHGSVRSVLNTEKDKESFFTSSSSASPAIVTADEMKYWKANQRAHYIGNVQLLSENGQLQAGKLDVFQGGSRVEAQGGIRHYIPERAASENSARADKTNSGPKPNNNAMVIQASELKYFRENSLISYLGSVSAHSGDIDMASESLDVVLAEDGKSVERANARGKVSIRQGERICKGDTADYFLNPHKFVLLGNPAEVNDPEKGKSYAGRLTSFLSDDRILLENR